eukprot:scaffold7724_cov248-Pinguiococcus_pyrenoidosus.AAC.1
MGKPAFRPKSTSSTAVVTKPAPSGNTSASAFHTSRRGVEKASKICKVKVQSEDPPPVEYTAGTTATPTSIRRPSPGSPHPQPRSRHERAWPTKWGTSSRPSPAQQRSPPQPAPWRSRPAHVGGTLLAAKDDPSGAAVGRGRAAHVMSLEATLRPGRPAALIPTSKPLATESVLCRSVGAVASRTTSSHGTPPSDATFRPGTVVKTGRWE